MLCPSPKLIRDAAKRHPEAAVALKMLFPMAFPMTDVELCAAVQTKLEQDTGAGGCPAVPLHVRAFGEYENRAFFLPSTLCDGTYIRWVIVTDSDRQVCLVPKLCDAQPEA